MYITFREAEESDLVVLSDLLASLFSIEADFQIDGKKQQSGLKLLLQSQQSNIIIARTHDKIVGMVTGQLLISTAEGRHSLLIEDLVVEEEFRGKGIGSELLSRISSWAVARGAERMQLLADKTNHKALTFYKGLQWSATHLICLRKYSTGVNS